MSDIPTVEPKPYTHTRHGDSRPDEYFWLKDRDNPEVLAYLEAENRYFDHVMEPLRPVQEALYRDMLARIPAAEEGVPVRYGPYFYYWRINTGDDYRAYYRKRAASRAELPAAREELLLDTNALAADGGYLDVARVRVSPDHQRLLHLENHDGTDRYTLHVQDLNTHARVGEPVPNVFIDASTAWDASGDWVYYLTADAAQRPHRLHRRHLKHGTDEVLFEEADIRYSLSLHASRSGQYLFLTSQIYNTSSEVWYLPLHDPRARLRVFQPRRASVMYLLEHWQDQFVILTNEGAENFTVLTVPVDRPDPAEAEPLIPYDPDRYLQHVLPFSDALVLEGRENGLTQLWVYRQGTLTRLGWNEALYTVSAGANLAYQTEEFLVEYRSLVTPRTDILVDLATGATSRLAQDAVRDYDPKRYDQRQVWVTARDGARVPVSLVARRDLWERTPAPLILYGYGAYGATSDPEFAPELLPVLDRGVIYAIAHVRGGSELGDAWYRNGKLLQKRNTFSDFVDAASALVDEGYTRPELLAAEGASAGGLLMGAVVNLRPDLFRVVAAGVPFVDVITTMLDASIPLTALEWDEWGNPEDADLYVYMKSYSPYDNVEAKDYPHLFVVAGLNDPRVGYFEPAKWVARLRATKSGQHDLVLKTHMGSGHFGTSGRLAHLKDEAEQYAFLLDKLGVRP
ncbi:MAG: S9 family peptidase [Clostridia bacterium]